ncbi:MAG: right-handed parallel beta-helix repeat-containing protein, partial [Polyangiaceae bacterium]
MTKPFKTVQSSATGAQATAWGHVHAGDTIVLRAGTYQGVGFEHYFMRFIIATSGYSTGTSGTAPTGTAGTGPIALIAYPGEDAFIDGDSSFDSAGCLAGLNGENYPNAGKWITIANLRIEGGGYDGPISQEIHGDHWRVVNNEITATTGVTSGASPSRMAGITGNGAGAAWLGNHIHDIQGSQNEAHGIYIDGDGDYDIAYNVIHDCKSGKGIQTYSNGENGSDTISNVRIHHNIVHDVAQFGINVADGSKDGFEIYDNVVYSAKTGGLRFNTTTLAGAKIYNNTFADDDTSKDESSAALMSDWNLAAGALDVKNNIFVATTGTALTGGSVGISASVGTFANNVWFGDAAPSFDSTAVVSDPNFVTPGSDFHLQSGSPAAGSGSSAVST